MQKQEILKACEETYLRCCELFPEYKSLPKPEIKFTTRGKAAGKAGITFSTGYNFVQFNTVIAENAGSDFINTIQHEYSHLVQFKLYPFSKAHGNEFKRIHRMLGGTGETYHRYSVEGVTGLQKKYEWVCDCRTHLVGSVKHKRMYNGFQVGIKFRCSGCKTVVLPKNEF